MSSVIVAYSSEEARRRVRLLLESGGWRCAACVSSGGEAIRAVRTLDGDAVVICGARLGDMTASQLAASVSGSGSVVVIASAASLDLCEGENLYKLASPAARSDFFALLDLLARTARKRRPPPCRDEESQGLIRRAKEILMDVNRMSEPEAHRFLQKQSMDCGWKLTETAQWVIESYTH